MSCTRNSARLALAASLAVMLAGTALADTLVVFSRGPSAKLYPPGKSLPEGSAIKLQTNDQLTLLDGRGTRTLRGPGDFNLARLAAAAPPASDINTRLTLLTAAGSDRRVRIGAVRGASSAEMRSPNLWYVDVTRSGTVCVADPAALTLWRAGTDRDQAVVITGGKGPSRLTWPQGTTTLAWPAGVPITTGAEYSLKVGDSAPVRIRFAVLDSRPSGMENTASTLITDGCDSQLDLLVQTFSVPADETSPAG